MLQVAKVLKSNGADGELVLNFLTVDPEDLKTTEPVYIEFDGLPVPFFIESMTRRGTTKALVHLTDIDSGSAAEELVGRAVFAREDDVEGAGDEEDFSFLVGWTLLDAASAGDVSVSPIGIGEIVAFEDIPGNPCIEVRTPDGRETLVPLHEDLIMNVDGTNCEITMSLPAGLFQ